MEVTRRTFLASSAGAGLLLAARLQAAPPPFDLEEATVADLQAGLKAGRYTARALADKYLARIRALDKTLASILVLNKDALSLADQADAARKAGKRLGPLHGIPVLIKGNIDTADGMPTTAGSAALSGSRAPRDAPLVDRLRAAGAIILGKTNLSEWANFRSTHSSSGWSGEGGQARNPYALDRSPSGSSSGSAIAAAANFCAVAVGTETDGSILSPCSCNSLVGIKPTVGLIPGAGIIPIAHTQDTAGPMTRTVADAALLLGVLAGADYSASLDAAGLKGARIGVGRKSFFGYSPPADRIAEEALRALREAGAVLVDPSDITTADDLGDAELEVLLYEFKADLNAYLAGRPDAPVKTLADVIAFNEANKAKEMPLFGQELFVMAEKKGPLTTPAYRKALAKCRRLMRTRGIDATLKKNRIDAIVAPTNGPAWLIDHVNGDASGGSSTSPAAVAGYPAITVPAGFASGLPVGLTFMGPARSEAKLIRFAYAFEQATKARKPPRFLPSATP